MSSLLFMHKQTAYINLNKKPAVHNRLHYASGFKVYKPINEKVKLNVSYRGAMEWNALPACDHHFEFKDFKNQTKAIMNGVF